MTKISSFSGSEKGENESRETELRQTTIELIGHTTEIMVNIKD